MSLLGYVLGKNYTDQKTTELKPKIAKNTAGIQALESTLTNINVNQESRQEVEAYGDIATLPKTAGSGGLLPTLGGMTLTNAGITNNSFEDGLTGWAATGTASTEETTIVRNGQKARKFTYAGGTGRIEQVLSAVAGHKYYIAAHCYHSAMTTLADIGLWVWEGSMGTVTVAASAATGVWQKLTTIHTAVGTSVNIALGCRNQNATSTTVFDSCMMIDLTALFGAGNEPTADQMNAIAPEWFDGTGHAEALRVRSVGKNLWREGVVVKGQSAISGYGGTSGTFNADGSLTLPASNAVANTIKVPKSVFYLTYTVQNTSGIEIFVWDSNGKQLRTSAGSRTAGQTYTLAISTLPDTYYVKAAFGAYGGSNTIINIQLEPSTVATSYEPYTESMLYTEPYTLRRLPNGVADTIEDGKYVRRVGFVELDGSENWANFVVLDTVYRVGLDTVTWLDGVFNGAYLINDSMWIGNVSWTRLVDFLASSEHYYASQTGLNLFVEKSKVDSMPSGGTLAGIKEWIASNGISLYYQLATPIETDNVTSGTPLSNPSGTVYLEPALADAGVYSSQMDILLTDFPIDSLETLRKVEFITGAQTPLDVADAVIAVDGLSFTHPSLSEGDIVFFTYLYSYAGVYGKNTYSFYDGRYVIEDASNGKFYKWAITSDNGVASIALTEV